MLRRIFEDGLRIQKNRLRELRQYAKGNDINSILGR